MIITANDENMINLFGFSVKYTAPEPLILKRFINLWYFIYGMWRKIRPLLKAFDVVRKRGDLFLLMVAIDLVFLSIVYIFGRSIGSLFPSDPTKLIGMFGTPGKVLAFLLFYLVVYHLIIIFIYSFFKLGILSIIKGLFVKERFAFRRLGKFYLLNVINYSLLFIVFLVLAAILSFIFKQEILKYVLMVVAVISAFFAYAFININHSLFIDHKRVFKRSLFLCFKRINKYIPVYVFSVLIALVYGVVIFLLFLLFKNFRYDGSAIMSVFTLIYFYLVLAFNRIYFYVIVKEM